MTQKSHLIYSLFFYKDPLLILTIVLNYYFKILMVNSEVTFTF